MKNSISLLNLDQSLRPREHLKELGARQIPTYELVAILLRTGTSQQNVVELAMSLLSSISALADMKEMTTTEFERLPGIGEAKAITLMAAIEFGRRVYQSSIQKDGQITSSHQVGEYLMNELGHYSQEHVLVLYLNTKNEILEKKCVFIGGLNSSVAHPREIFRYAVKLSAARLIISHNHPSGNVTPSEEDLQFTKRLKAAGEIIGIEILDHIVVSDSTYLSFQEEGLYDQF